MLNDPKLEQLNDFFKKIHIANSYMTYSQILQESFFQICHDVGSDFTRTYFLSHLYYLLDMGLHTHDRLGMDEMQHNEFILFLKVLCNILPCSIESIGGFGYVDVLFDFFSCITCSIDESIRDLGQQAFKACINKCLLHPTGCERLVNYLLINLEKFCPKIQAALCQLIPFLFCEKILTNETLWHQLKKIVTYCVMEITTYLFINSSRIYLTFFESPNLSLRRQSLLVANLIMKRLVDLKTHLNKDTDRNLTELNETHSLWLKTCMVEIMNFLLKLSEDPSEAVRLAVVDSLLDNFTYIDNASLETDVFQCYDRMKEDTSSRVFLKLLKFSLKCIKNLPDSYTVKSSFSIWKEFQFLLQLLCTSNKQIYMGVLDELGSQPLTKENVQAISLKQQDIFLEAFAYRIQELTHTDSLEQLLCVARNTLPSVISFDRELVMKHIFSVWRVLYTSETYPQTALAAFESLVSADQSFFTSNGSHFLILPLIRCENVMTKVVLLFRALSPTSYDFLKLVKNETSLENNFKKNSLFLAWRLRHKFVQLIPFVLPYMTQESKLSLFLVDCCLSMIEDSVCLVRVAAINASIGVVRLNVPDFQEKLFSLIKSQAQHENYLHRMSHIHFQYGLILSGLFFTKNLYSEIYYELFHLGLNDTISNVRDQQMSSIVQLLQRKDRNYPPDLLNFWEQATKTCAGGAAEIVERCECITLLLREIEKKTME